ncbi:MAG: PD-(D/E)XK nuclease family protein, partial [Clostridia bacterium]|nr:PD-(D/E)XK nuclease family protein [Clostridia bacterium]
MSLSASRVDNYYHCPFQYFCRYGLGAEPRKRATLGANHYGTIIHYVLEQLLKETDKETFVGYTPSELEGRVDHWLTVYAEEDLGGLSDKTTRFQYLYDRVRAILYEVASRLQEELRVSDFVPSDFELSIGKEQEVESYTLELPDGGTLAVKGSVDRVDLYEHDGKTYVRVVDYKSGGKEFELSDILYGLNLQMLLYLFTIGQNGTGNYDDTIPAGILYYPAKRKTGSVAGRDAPPDTVESNESAKDRENGLFLRDPQVLEAMEHGLEGNYIPIKLTKDAAYTKTAELSLASLQELGILQKRIDYLLKKMAAELHRGAIPALPAQQNDRLPCDYCDYRSVCRQDQPEVRVIEKFPDREELMARMQQEETEEVTGHGE